MTLSERQQKFALMASKLIQYAFAQGYAVTLGEAYRTPEMARIYAERGTGIVKSKHCLKLAIDLNLFKDGEYLQSTEAHRPLGVFWKSLDKDNRWGGDFPLADGNHYEFSPS